MRFAHDFELIGFGYLHDLFFAVPCHTQLGTLSRIYCGSFDISFHRIASHHIALQTKSLVKVTSRGCFLVIYQGMVGGCGQGVVVGTRNYQQITTHHFSLPVRLVHSVDTLWVWFVRTTQGNGTRICSSGIFWKRWSVTKWIHVSLVWMLLQRFQPQGREGG